MNPSESLKMFSQIGLAVRKEELQRRVKKLNTVVLANLNQAKYPNITDDTPVTEDMILEVLIKLDEDSKIYPPGDPVLVWIKRDVAVVDALTACRTTLRKLGEVFE